jgi:hypothetical protein
MNGVHGKSLRRTNLISESITAAKAGINAMSDRVSPTGTIQPTILAFGPRDWAH